MGESMFKEDETGSANKQHHAKEEPVTQDNTLSSEMHKADGNKENYFYASNRPQNEHAIFSEENRESYLGKRTEDPDRPQALYQKPSKKQAGAPFGGLQAQPPEPVFGCADLEGEIGREGSSQESEACRARAALSVTRRPRRAAVAFLEEISQHLLATDNSATEGLNYMRVVQTDINSDMRRILIDWLIDVHARFALKSETLHKSVFFMDRFLSSVDIHRNSLQLVGITSLYIAAKLEEVSPPAIQSFVYVCDNAYTKLNIVDMEARILQAAEFRLVIATGLQILGIFAEQLRLNAQEFWLARYFLDYSMVKYSLCGKRTRFLAAGAVLLTLYYFHYPATAVDNFIKVNCLEFSEVRLCSYLVWEAVLEGKSSPDFTAVERKYSDAAVYRVSELPVNTLQTFFHAK